MVQVTGETLSIEELALVARSGAKVAPLGAEVKSRMMESYDWVQRAMADGGRVVYGVNTGYGPLAKQHIPADQARQLSRNLVLTCMVGVGEPLPPDLVRGMMLVRANTLAKGLSGVRPTCSTPGWCRGSPPRDRWVRVATWRPWLTWRSFSPAPRAEEMELAGRPGSAAS